MQPESVATGKTTPTDAIPREERSYKEFFPDLLVDEPLSVQVVAAGASAASLESPPPEPVAVAGQPETGSTAPVAAANELTIVLPDAEDSAEVSTTNADEPPNGHTTTTDSAMRSPIRSPRSPPPAAPLSPPDGPSPRKLRSTVRSPQSPLPPNEQPLPFSPQVPARRRCKSTSLIEAGDSDQPLAEPLDLAAGSQAPIENPIVIDVIDDSDVDAPAIATPTENTTNSISRQRRHTTNGAVQYTFQRKHRPRKTLDRAAPNEGPVREPSQASRRKAKPAAPIIKVPQPFFRNLSDDTSDPLFLPHIKSPVPLPVLPSSSTPPAAENASGSLLNPQLGAELSMSRYFGTATEDSEIVVELDSMAPPASQTNGKSTDGWYRRGSANISVAYVKHTEMSEQEMNLAVEYDMDDRDKIWVDELLQRRRAALGDDQGGDAATAYDVFERIIDRLEKEWFDLTRDLQQKLQQKEQAQLPDDGNCAICDDGECENSNAIVFCDGCNVAVHQECYGVPYIPEGQWLCRKCLVSPERPVTCIFCPIRRGAYKQTTGNQWAHLLCALWISETSVANPVYMEPIDGVDKIPKSRWKLLCYICHRKVGACIQCYNRSCFTAFHPSCAQRAKLYMKSQGTREMRAYCDKHAPPAYDVKPNFQQVRREIADQCESTGEEYMMASPEEIAQGFCNADELPSAPKSYASSKSNSHRRRKTLDIKVGKRRVKPLRVTSPVSDESDSPETIGSSGGLTPTLHDDDDDIDHKYTIEFNPLLPVVPHVIFEKIMLCLPEYRFPGKEELVASVCKYWALKRETRRGAPLLRRLHLEPWTAVQDGSQPNKEERRQRVEALGTVRQDLEALRMLAEMVQKREREKLRQLRALEAYWRAFMYPLAKVLDEALTLIAKGDKRNTFFKPVDPEEVPDYYEYIKQPMDFSTMREKIANLQYADLAAFEQDLALIWSNCQTYNAPETIYAKDAVRLAKLAETTLTRVRGQLGFEPSLASIGLLSLPFDDAVWGQYADADVDVTSPTSPVQEGVPDEPPTSASPVVPPLKATSPVLEPMALSPKLDQPASIPLPAVPVDQALESPAEEPVVLPPPPLLSPKGSLLPSVEIIVQVGRGVPPTAAMQPQSPARSVANDESDESLVIRVEEEDEEDGIAVVVPVAVPHPPSPRAPNDMVIDVEDESDMLTTLSDAAFAMPFLPAIIQHPVPLLLDPKPRSPDVPRPVETETINIDALPLLWPSEGRHPAVEELVDVSVKVPTSNKKRSRPSAAASASKRSKSKTQSKSNGKTRDESRRRSKPAEALKEQKALLPPPPPPQPPAVAAPSPLQPSTRTRRVTRRSALPVFVSDATPDLVQGQAVWAKMEHYPWHPAQVLDFIEDLSDGKDHTGQVVLVEFYDQQKSWTELKPEFVKPLGVDVSKDIDILADTSEEVSERKRLQAHEGYMQVMRLLGRDGGTAVAEAQARLNIPSSPLKPSPRPGNGRPPKRPPLSTAKADVADVPVPVLVPVKQEDGDSAMKRRVDTPPIEIMSSDLSDVSDSGGSDADAGTENGDQTEPEERQVQQNDSDYTEASEHKPAGKKKASISRKSATSKTAKKSHSKSKAGKKKAPAKPRSKAKDKTRQLKLQAFLSADSPSTPAVSTTGRFTRSSIGNRQGSTSPVSSISASSPAL
ncbi:hypothetical protein RI367_003390 [Sorochytrium milnesiophthora]